MIDEGSGAVVHELDIDAPADRVFAMFTDPDRLVRWIGLTADVDARPGGRFRFEIVPGEFCEGEYVEVDPPRRVVVTWGWTDPSFGVPPGSSRVTVELTELDGARTRLRLTHDQLPDEAVEIHDEGWTKFLAQLKEHA